MILEKEISLIKDPKLREAVRKCIKDNEKKLKILPASTSGKYHPPDERGPGGLVRHIKKVVWFIDHLGREFALDQEDLDILLVAGVLHDIALVVLTEIDQDGRVILEGRRYKDHPKISAQMTNKYLTDAGFEPTSPTVIKILDLIRSHMSRWHPNCKQPYDRLEFFLCMADYFCSLEDVEIHIDKDKKQKSKEKGHSKSEK